MKLLGIDFGEKNLGLAFSEGFLPTPLPTIAIKTQKQVLAEITEIVKRLEIGTIVLGLSGGKLDPKVKAFGALLAKHTQVPVVYVDETLSSREAITKMVEAKTSRKKRRAMDHSVAATIILNTNLESQQS